MKKILVIMGSPRKGESYSVMKRVEEHILTMGEVEFDYLWLRDIKFKQCTGCHACINLGENKCPFRGDVADVEARMLAADGMIIVTPVYTQQVSYLVKILFDRFAYMWHRPRMFGKFVMSIAAGGGMTGPVHNYIKENVKSWGCTYVNQLTAQHPESLQPKMRARLEKDVLKAARRFYETVQRGQHPAPSFGDLIWFRMWRMNAKAGKTFSPTDYAYWTEKGWMNQEFFTAAPINPVKRLAARGMELPMRMVMRRIYTSYENV